MATRFELEHKAFSDRAHEAAKRLIYPRVFNAPAHTLSFQSHDVASGGNDAFLDGTLGIDKTVGVACNHLKQDLEFTVQERFREPKFAGYEDLTITEWNGATNSPSELYKIKAQLFVYGYYNEETGGFTDAIAVNIPRMLQGIGNNDLQITHGVNNKQQSFVAVKFDALLQYGAVIYWQKKAPPRIGRRIGSFDDFTELWPDVLQRVKCKIGVTAVAYLHDARPSELTETDIVIEYSKEFHYEKAREAASHLPYEQVLNECLATPHRLVFRLSDTQGATQ